MRRFGALWIRPALEAPSARARDHRDRAAEGQRCRAKDIAATPCARREDRAGRLWNRLFEPQPSHALPARQGEDRPILHSPVGQGGKGRDPDRERRTAFAPTRHCRHRRRGRDHRATRTDEAARADRRRAGISVQQADPERRGREALSRDKPARAGLAHEGGETDEPFKSVVATIASALIMGLLCGAAVAQTVAGRRRSARRRRRRTTRSCSPCFSGTISRDRSASSTRNLSGKGSTSRFPPPGVEVVSWVVDDGHRPDRHPALAGFAPSRGQPRLRGHGLGRLPHGILPYLRLQGGRSRGTPEGGRPKAERALPGAACGPAPFLPNKRSFPSGEERFVAEAAQANRRTNSRRSTRRARGRARLLRARRILSRRSRCAARRRHRGDGLPAGGRRGDHGADRRAADGPAGHLLRDARPRRDERRARRPYRRARFGADDPVHRAGRARACSGRGAFQEMDYRAFFGSTVKWATEVEDAARIPEIIQRAFHVAMQGRPGPVVIALPEDVLTEAAAVADAPRAEAARDLARPDANGRAAEDAMGRRAPARHPRRRRLERARRRGRHALRRALRPARRRLLPPRQPRRRRAIPISPARSASGPIRSSRRASKRPISCCWSAGACRRCRRRAIRCSPSPSPRQTLVHVHADRARDRPHLSSAAWASSRRRRPSAPRSKGSSRRIRSPGAEATRAARADYLAWSDAARPPTRGRCNSARSCCSCAGGARRVLHQRRRQFRDLARPLPALPPFRAAARPDLRLDGLRPAGRDRRQARLSRSRRSSASPATATF